MTLYTQTRNIIMKQLIILLVIWMVNMASSDIDGAKYDRLLKEVMDKDSSSKRSTRTTEIIYSGAGELPLKCISTLSKTCWFSEYEEAEGSGGMSDNRCECRCNTGFYPVSNNCITIRVFGGGLVYDNPYHDSHEVINQTTKDYLNDIYGSDEKFQGINIISSSEEAIIYRSTGATIVVYELLFDASSNKKEDDIVELLDDHCSSNSTTFGNFTLNCNESLSYVYDQITKCGTIYSDYCDHQSTSCHVNDGEAYCLCRDNFYNINNHFTSCTEQTCLSDSDCTAPFGKCLFTSDQQTSSCTCFWGFNGSQCENFTIFVLTAVIGLILVIIIIILLCRCCRQGNKKKKSLKKESSSDVLGTLADLSEVQFDYQPGQMRARLPSQKPRVFPRSATSTFSGPSVNTSSGRVESSGVSLHHYTNQSFVGVDHVKHARAQLNKDLKRADYF